jgi:hypothetical protein
MPGEAIRAETSFKLLGDSPYFKENDKLGFHELARGMVDLLNDAGEATAIDDRGRFKSQVRQAKLGDRLHVASGN